MRIRALLFLSALAATALLGIGAGSASAATLFTTTAHTARVTVGAIAVGTGTNVDLTSGTAVINHCAHSSLNLLLDQNNDTAVVGTVTAGSFNGCNNPVTPTFLNGGVTANWVLTVSGNSSLINDQNCWNASVDRVTFDLLGGQYAGNLTGVTACQPTSGSPLTLRLPSAGSVAGPLTGNGRIDGSYVFTGAAAAYSLTN
jgi:hypothetical protein